MGFFDKYKAMRVQVRSFATLKNSKTSKMPLLENHKQTVVISTLLKKQTLRVWEMLLQSTEALLKERLDMHLDIWNSWKALVIQQLMNQLVALKKTLRVLSLVKLMNTRTCIQEWPKQPEKKDLKRLPSGLKLWPKLRNHTLANSRKC